MNRSGTDFGTVIEVMAGESRVKNFGNGVEGITNGIDSSYLYLKYVTNVIEEDLKYL